MFQGTSDYEGILRPGTKVATGRSLSEYCGEGKVHGSLSWRWTQVGPVHLLTYWLTQVQLGAEEFYLDTSRVDGRTVVPGGSVVDTLLRQDETKVVVFFPLKDEWVG